MSFIITHLGVKSLVFTIYSQSINLLINSQILKLDER